MKTVILAGGLGTRLAEETAVRPKPMPGATSILSTCTAPIDSSTRDMPSLRSGETYWATGDDACLARVGAVPQAPSGPSTAERR